MTASLLLTHAHLAGAGPGSDHAAAAALLARGGAAQGTPQATPGEWSFTDDMGVTVTVPTVPTRIVAALTVRAALADFGIEPVGMIGAIELPDGSRSPAAGNPDPARTTSIALGSDGGPDLEVLIALEPDLIVTSVLQGAEGADPLPSGFLPETLGTVQEIAPILAFNNTATSVAAIIARLDELTTALGVERPAGYAAVQEAFVAAEQQVRRVLEAKPDLTVLAVAGGRISLFSTLITGPISPTGRSLACSW